MKINELKNLVDEAMQENTEQKKTTRIPHNPDYFQLGFGYEEQPYLTTEERKDLDDLLWALEKWVGIKPHELKNLLATKIARERIIETWQRIKNRLNTDEGVKDARHRKYNVMYPKGHPAGD